MLAELSDLQWPVSVHSTGAQLQKQKLCHSLGVVRSANVRKVWSVANDSPWYVTDTRLL